MKSNRTLSVKARLTVVLIAASLSWAVAVDLTPPENRPYVGSSDNNTVMELITGHNGLRRLFPMRPAPSLLNAGQPARPPTGGSSGQFQAPPPPPPPGGQPGPFPPQQPPQGPGGGPGPRNPRVSEIGEASALRLLTEPLVTGHFPFEQYEEAYHFIEKHGDTTLKVVIDVDA